jgi:hypothetical protein
MSIDTQPHEIDEMLRKPGDMQISTEARDSG